MVSGDLQVGVATFKLYYSCSPCLFTIILGHCLDGVDSLHGQFGQCRALQAPGRLQRFLSAFSLLLFSVKAIIFFSRRALRPC